MFRRGVGSPLSIAREHVIYKTPHDGVYVVTCHYLWYDIFGHHVTGLANKIVYWPQWWVEHVMGPTKCFLLEWLRRCFIKFTEQWQMENDIFKSYAFSIGFYLLSNRSLVFLWCREWKHTVNIDDVDWRAPEPMIKCILDDYDLVGNFLM